MAPNLPKISTAVVDSITDMLISDQGMLRPPTQAAKLLALVVELHKKDAPFPDRATVARHIGASVSTVDAALSTRLDEGYISQSVRTVPGSVARRNGVVRQRFYTPSSQLLMVAERAKSRRR